MSKTTRTLFTLIVALGATLWFAACSPQPSETAKEDPAPKEEVAQAPAETEAESSEPAEEASSEPAAGAIAFESEDWDDWFQDKAIWVGSMKEFDLRTDKRAITEGLVSLKANAKAGDGRIRDLYLARHFTDLTPGKTYDITLDYRFDIDKPDQNYIQFAVASGDHADQKAIANVEDYPDRPVPTTKQVDQTTLGTEEFHPLEVSHTLAEGESDMTLMMIVRFQAKSRRKNYFYMDNLQLIEK
ncbi:MAG: hypothetical protein P9L94_08025 [Candidatus Hinthialibacter antarcticus]|nr:hypothetical protein [Candidatus Hinthialibacter antarcticus]